MLRTVACTLAAACALLTADVSAATWTGRVVEVTDGDTLAVANGGRTVAVRLAEIDAPEDGQSGGDEASAALLALIADHEEVTVEERDVDRYGRTVARVSAGGVDLGEAMVREGHAWHYKRYSRDAHLAELEDEARATHRGLWGMPAPVAPWDYRHGGAAAAPEIALALATIGGDPPKKGGATPVEFSCAGKRRCGDMDSCEEARFYLSQCGMHRLDGDGDGVPCEKLCN